MSLRRDLLACLVLALLVVAIVVERQARSGDLSARSMLDARRPYTLIGVQSGKCVAAAADPAGGATLQLSTCNGSRDQRFALEPRGGRTYRLRNVGTGRCVDVQGISTDSGAPVIQFGCNEGRNQRWAFTRVSPHQSTSWPCGSQQPATRTSRAALCKTALHWSSGTRPTGTTSVSGWSRRRREDARAEVPAGQPLQPRTRRILILVAVEPGAG